MCLMCIEINKARITFKEVNAALPELQLDVNHLKEVRGLLIQRYLHSPGEKTEENIDEIFRLTDLIDRV